MTDGTCMSGHPRTFSVGRMHLAIVDDFLCLRVDDATEWPRATWELQMTVQDGDMLSEYRESSKSEIAALGKRVGEVLP